MKKNILPFLIGIVFLLTYSPLDTFGYANITIDPIDAYNQYVWQTQTNDSISYWGKIAAGNGKYTYYSPYRLMWKVGLVHVLIFVIFYRLMQHPKHAHTVIVWIRKTYHLPRTQKVMAFSTKTYHSLRNARLTKQMLTSGKNFFRSIKESVYTKRI